MAYFYDLPGFALMIDRGNDDLWRLNINARPVGAYVSPYQAVVAAATQQTGDKEYDESPIAAPEDLREWSNR